MKYIVSHDIHRYHMIYTVCIQYSSLPHETDHMYSMNILNIYMCVTLRINKYYNTT